MKDIDIVLSCLKKYHYQPWVEGELEECKRLLSAMDKEKLRMVRHSRWMDKDNALYPTLFEYFYQDELKDVIRHLKEMPTNELILELKKSKSSFKKEKIPEILLERYDSMEDEERKSVFKILLRKGLVEKNS